MRSRFKFSKHRFDKDNIQSSGKYLESKPQFKLRLVLLVTFLVYSASNVNVICGTDNSNILLMTRDLYVHGGR